MCAGVTLLPTQLITPPHVSTAQMLPGGSASPPAAARQLSFSPIQQHSPHMHTSHAPMQPSSSQPQQHTLQDTPYWKTQCPGPNVFTDAWAPTLNNVALRKATLQSAPLPAMVYEPSAGSAAIAPANFTQLVAQQVTASVTALLAAAGHLGPAPPAAAMLPAPQAAQARQPLQPQPQQQAREAGHEQAEQIVPLAGVSLPSLPAGLLAAVPPCSVPEPTGPGKRVVPNFSAVDSLDDLFAWWYDGMNGEPAISSLPVSQRNAKNVKQRWHEWSKFFSAVQTQLDGGQTRAQSLAGLKLEMEQLSAELASQAKKRKRAMTVSGFVAVKTNKRT